ncbi:hypothetical protein AB3329_01810 [Streptococcus sp. H31]|uniref:hypothetical protein n=1 Tax=Streptococcus huangxiaojuni TaxID=3237239 RepID=UPI0034A35F8D
MVGDLLGSFWRWIVLFFRKRKLLSHLKKPDSSDDVVLFFYKDDEVGFEVFTNRGGKCYLVKVERSDFDVISGYVDDSDFIILGGVWQTPLVNFFIKNIKNDRWYLFDAFPLD